MARPLRITFPGAFYHVTSRGNERKAVFKSKRDRLKFLEYLESATSRYDASMHIYCLIDNHYHLLIETPAGNLPQIMRHINGAYTTYFNVTRGRSGHLFQGRYKAILVEIDAYAKELSRYIHMNPVRAGIVSLPGEFEWSSYQAYIGAASPPGWLNTEHILDYFAVRTATAQKRYREYVESIIDHAYVSPLREVVGGTILGGNDYVETIKKEHLSKVSPKRDVPALRKLLPVQQGELIDSVVHGLVKPHTRLARDLSIYARLLHTGATLKSIGSHYGLSESGVSQVRRRLENRKRKDVTLSRMIAVIEKEVQLSKR
jgi:REP element-mobilizing transposase RayT